MTQTTVWSGTALVDATTIKIFATTVKNTNDECGQRSETTSPPETMLFDYTFDGTVLSAIDANCASKYPDSPSSQSLYCKNDYPRE